MSDAIVNAVTAASTLLGGVGTVASAFKKTPDPPPLPEIKEPAVLPDVDQEEAALKRRKEYALQRKKMGRASTLLSDGNRRDTLG